MLRKRKCNFLLATSLIVLPELVFAQAQTGVLGYAYPIGFWLLAIALVGLILFYLRKNRKARQERAASQSGFQIVDSIESNDLLKPEMDIEQGKVLLRQVNKLEFLRILEGNKLQPNPRQLDVDLFINQLVRSFSSIAQILKVDFSMDSRIKKLMMDFDPDLMIIALGNLFSQAFDNILDPSSLKVKVRNERGRLVISVIKQGLNADPEVLNQLIKSNTPLSSKSPNNYQVRMKITSSVIKKMGGTLEVKPGKDQAIIYEIKIPISQVEEVDHAFSTINAKDYWRRYLSLLQRYVPKPNESDESDIPKILILGLGAETAAFIAFCLGDQVYIYHSSSGQEMMKLVKEHDISLVISHAVLPDAHCLDLCESLKGNPATHDVAFILISSDPSLDFKHEALNSGVDVYLERPFDHKEMLIRIQQLLKKPRTVESKSSEKEINFVYPFDIDDLDQPGKEFLKDAKQIIDDNLLDSQFGLAVFSQKMHLSESQLRRKIFALTGLTPVRFIRQHRIGKSIELLKQSDLNISQIAYETGFSDPKYFSRVFAKEIGASPTEFRLKIKRTLLTL